MLLRYFRKKETIAVSSRYVTIYQTDCAADSRAKAMERDFCAHLEFNGKSFWEKIILGKLLVSGARNYPQLRGQYKKQLMWCYLTKTISLYVGILNRLVKKFNLLTNRSVLIMIHINNNIINSMKADLTDETVYAVGHGLGRGKCHGGPNKGICIHNLPVALDRYWMEDHEFVRG